MKPDYHPTPGQMLGDELVRRREAEDRYSLRAFADDLGLSPAFLSRVISEQRELSLGKATSLIKRINWSADKKHLFLLLVRRQECQDPQEWETIDREISIWVGRHPQFHPLRLDAMALTARWYHYAIFELVSLPHFNPDPKWLGKRLGILPLEASLALERLKRVGMLKSANNCWQQAAPNFDTGDVPSQMIREYHQQMLRLAAQAVMQQSPEERYLKTVTLAIDPSRLPEANRRIAAFQQELTAFLNCGDLQAVYQFSMQLFRLDRLEEV